MTIYGQQAPVAVQGLTSNTLISNNTETLDIVSTLTNVSGNLTVGAATVARNWTTYMGNLSGHSSSFGSVVGMNGSVLAVGFDYYYPYAAQFDSEGNLQWQGILSYASEGWIGHISQAVPVTTGDFAGNIVIGGTVYTGHEGVWLQTISFADGSSTGPGAVISSNASVDTYLNSLAVSATNVAMTGVIDSFNFDYTNVAALTGSEISEMGVNVSVFNGNTPDSVTVGNGQWSITGGGLGGTVATVSAINTWYGLEPQYISQPPGPGGSMVFAGVSGSYAVIPASGDFSPGQNYTIEFWINANISSTGSLFGVISQDTGTTALALDIVLNNGYLSYRTDGTGNFINYTEPTPGTWTIVAIVNANGTQTVFYNGVAQTSASGTPGQAWWSDTTQAIYLGRRGNNDFQYFPGKLTNIRITAALSLYSTNYPAPTSPLVVTNTETLLLLDVFDSGNLAVDSSNYDRTVTLSNVSYSASTPLTKINENGSIYFNGGVVTIPSGSQWALGTTWTMEFWSYALISSVGGTIMTVLSQDSLSVHDIDVTYTGGYIRLGDVTTSQAEPPPGQWTFVTIQENAGTISIYFNGVYQGNGGIEGYDITNGSSAVYLGASTASRNYPFSGWITNLRISNAALYSGNFAAPSAPLTSSGSTLVLLLTASTGTALLDSSSYDLAISQDSTSWSATTPLVKLPYGTNSAFTASFTDGTGYSISLTNAGNGYSSGDQLFVSGNLIAGGNSANNLYINVNGVTGTGGINSFTHAGTPNYSASNIWLYTTNTNDYSANGPYTINEYQNNKVWVGQLNTDGFNARALGSAFAAYGASIVYDNTGNIYVGGQWDTPTNSEDIIVKLDQNLNTVWSTNLGSNNGWTNTTLLLSLDNSNIYVITDSFGGDQYVSYVNAATGTGYWTSAVNLTGMSINGGSEGGVLTPDGDVIVAGWANGPWGSEGMLASRISGVDGTWQWTNVLYNTNGILGGQDYVNPPFSLADDHYFTGGGYAVIGGASEGAMTFKLPIDGTGQGTYDNWVYAPISTSTTVSPNTGNSRSLLNEPANLAYAAEGFVIQDLHPEVFTREALGGNRGGNIYNTGTIFFADGSHQSSAASGNGIGNLTVTGNVITVHPDTVVEFNTNVTVTGSLVGSNVVSVGNTTTNSAMVWTNGSVPKVWQQWNSDTNSLDTYFS